MDPDQHHRSISAGMGAGGKVFLTDDILAHRDPCCDVLCLQEGRFRSEGAFNSSSYRVFSTRSDRGARGVQIWVHLAHASSVSAVTAVSDRLMTCCLTIRGIPCFVA